MMIRKKSLILCVLNPTYMFKRNNILIHILVSRECINMFFHSIVFIFQICLDDRKCRYSIYI